MNSATDLSVLLRTESDASALDLYRRTRLARAALTELETRRQSLTPRESQVMQLIVTGLMNKQVAQELGITEITVQIHRGRIMQKMGARSFAHLVRMAQALELSPVGQRFFTIMPPISLTSFAATSTV